MAKTAEQMLADHVNMARTENAAIAKALRKLMDELFAAGHLSDDAIKRIEGAITEGAAAFQARPAHEG